MGQQPEVVATVAAALAVLWSLQRGARILWSRHTRRRQLGASSSRRTRAPYSNRLPATRGTPPCTLWKQIQHRDWLFGLPPQIADLIMSRLDDASLKALRLTCKQTYLQVAARTTKLTLQLDNRGSSGLASARLDSIYPQLQLLRLIANQPIGPGRMAPHFGLLAFVSASLNGQLAKLSVLDLSRCSLLIPADVWVSLAHSLGPEVTLCVPWRCLLLAPPTSASASSALATPLSAQGINGIVGTLLSQLPRWPSAGCSCNLCGPTLPDSIPVAACLQLLACVRPDCSVELEGRGLPVRSPAALQQLCSLSQLTKLSLTVCGVRPLAHHAGWFSCLRKLHTLELKYREEGGADGPALPQILRALQAPVPLTSLALPRVNHLVGPDDISLLAELASLRDLEVAGMRVLQPIDARVTTLTRLAIRSERAEVVQPLVSLFPGLLHVELGHGVAEVPCVGGRSTLGGAGIVAEPLPGLQPAAPAVMILAGGLDGDALGGFPGFAAGAAQAAGVQNAFPLLGQAQGQAGDGLPPELHLHLRGLAGLSEVQTLSIGGRPGHGVESLGTLTSLSCLVLRRCSEFRPLRKAVEELRSLSLLRTLEMRACLGGESCGYEIARLLRRLQKLPDLCRLVVDSCDPRLAQQLATAPLNRLAEMELLGLPELSPLDLCYIAQAQTNCRSLVVRSCAKLSRALVEGLPQAINRPLLATEWGP